MIGELRRSALYVPGDSPRMLEKAADISADLLLLNLEDGIAQAKKAEARAHVGEALRSTRFAGKEVVVRVNSLESTTGREDLAEIVPCHPDGICLPKIEKAGDIHSADTALLELEIGFGLQEGALRLHAMIESASGVLHAAEIAAASQRMSSLIFGSADYLSDVRCRVGEDRTEILFALQMIVTAARSAGIDAIDAPCFDLRNPERLRLEARQARRLGFDGKSALRPDQIAIIHEEFDVTAAEVAWAEKVIAELNEAEKRGKALSTLDGLLIDNPHKAAAERILRRRK